MKNAWTNLKWLYDEGAGSGESKLLAAWNSFKYLLRHPVDTFTTSNWGAGG